MSTAGLVNECRAGAFRYPPDARPSGDGPWTSARLAAACGARPNRMPKASIRGGPGLARGLQARGRRRHSPTQVGD